MDVILRPLPGHAILLLLVQMGLLLVTARLLAEGMRRIGQPAVIGELLAGMLLGPTVLGHFSPELFAQIFPPDEAQFHFLEVISWLGMVLLLLLTGLETDIRAMRSLGKAALLTSTFGIAVTATSGFVLGMLLPDAYLTDPANRGIFAAFLATAMAITAMPVIAKILMDLQLIRRNIGMVILSAGVLDDTVGWLALSVIAGVAAGGAFVPSRFLLTIGALFLFILVLRWIAFPLMKRAIRLTNERFELVGTDLSLIIVFTFAAAAFTEFIGVHAVFGAFSAGLLIRQIPRIRTESIHALETFVLSALSPIFFAFVGLKVDLWTLSGWTMPALVIGIAMAAKWTGCYLGGRMGGLSHWEGMALGFGMNARGAMELIVAIIGLSLGLLTQEMYSTIVLVAVITSFLAPILLRTVIPRLPFTEEERRRLDADQEGSLIPEGELRLLIPTAGGRNALQAFRVIAPLLRMRGGEATALYVEASPASGVRGLRRIVGRSSSSKAGTNLDRHLEEAEQLITDSPAVPNGNGNGQPPPRRTLVKRRVVSSDVTEAILGEARRDYDLLLLGAGPEAVLDGPTGALVDQAPVSVAIVRSARHPHPKPHLSRILVPVNGSLFSRFATEFAAAVAAGSDAEIVLLHVVDAHHMTAASHPVIGGESGIPAEGEARRRGEEMTRDLEALAGKQGARVHSRIVTSASPEAAIVAQSRSGEFDLLVLGAENRMLGRPLFWGQGTAQILRDAECATVVVVPHLD